MKHPKKKKQKTIKLNNEEIVEKSIPKNCVSTYQLLESEMQVRAEQSEWEVQQGVLRIGLNWMEAAMRRRSIQM